MRLLPSHSISLTKKTCFYSLCPWGFHTGSENQQTEPLSIPYTVYWLTLVSFFILSAWAPFIFSYMPHHSFPIFSPSSSFTCLYTLALFFCSSPAVTYFSGSFSHIPATTSIACHHRGSHSSSLHHLLNGSFCDDVIWCCSSLILIPPSFKPVHQYPILQTWKKWLLENSRLWQQTIFLLGVYWHNKHHIPVCASFIPSQGVVDFFPPSIVRQAFLPRGWDWKVST